MIYIKQDNLLFTIADTSNTELTSYSFRHE